METLRYFYVFNQAGADKRVMSPTAKIKYLARYPQEHFKHRGTLDCGPHFNSPNPAYTLAYVFLGFLEPALAEGHVAVDEHEPLRTHLPHAQLSRRGAISPVLHHQNVSMFLLKFAHYF